MTDVMAMPLADIDWCEESGVPRSQCVQCQAEFQAVAASTPLRESRDRPVARHDACAPGTPSAEPAGHADRLDLTGQRFGRLVVVRSTGAGKASKIVVWLCECDCGATATVGGGDLRSGKTRSCGCLRRETSAASIAVFGSRISHGHCVNGQASPTYTSWWQMVRRCTDPTHPSYRYYGARGITACGRWLTFANFLADMGERPDGTELHRRDNAIGYQPGNCEWLPRAEHRALHHAEQRGKPKRRRIDLGGGTAKPATAEEHRECELPAQENSRARPTAVERERRLEMAADARAEVEHDGGES